jgi:hypothetical protein
MVAGLKRCRMPAGWEAGTLSKRHVSMSSKMVRDLTRCEMQFCVRTAAAGVKTTHAVAGTG